MTAITREGYEPDYRPSYRSAAIAALAVFVLYAVTLAPSTAMWDTSEYITAAYTLGIPHPPGNPFFMLLGHAFASLPIPVSYAAKINIMAAASYGSPMSARCFAGSINNTPRRRSGMP